MRSNGRERPFAAICKVIQLSVNNSINNELKKSVEAQSGKLVYVLVNVLLKAYLVSLGHLLYCKDDYMQSLLVGSALRAMHLDHCSYDEQPLHGLASSREKKHVRSLPAAATHREVFKDLNLITAYYTMAEAAAMSSSRLSSDLYRGQRNASVQ